MGSATRGMGRGLSAILAVGDAGGQADELRELPVELVRPNPNQPRKAFDDAALQSLADSIRERGVLQPVLVRPVPGGTYELVAGERRWRAARLAGLETVPALVRAGDDAASLELALIENMAREDLNPIEEARGCALLVEELGMTREAIGRRLGRSRVAVSNLLRLLDLPDEALALLALAALAEGHGRALLMAPDHADRRRLAREAAAEGWTVRETEDRARALAQAGDPAPRPRRRPQPHPDQVEAAERLGDAFGRALGTAVTVAPRGDGFQVSVAFGSLDEALATAERLGAVEHA